MKYTLSKHAQEVVQEREIKPEWLDQVFETPQLTESDPLDHDIESLFGVVKEYGNRVLHVVINKNKRPVKIVTAYFDRKMKGKL